MTAGPLTPELRDALAARLSDGALREVTDAYLTEPRGTWRGSAGALVAPLAISDADTIRAPYVVMAGLMVVVLALAIRRDALGRAEGIVLLTAYPVFVAVALWS